MRKLFVFLLISGFIKLCSAQLPTPNWELKTGDTYLRLAIKNNRPAVYAIKNRTNGWNWMNRFSEMPLPVKVRIGEKSVGPDWRYKDAITDKTNGVRLTLRFISTVPELELESVWQARPGAGPVENQVTIRNTSGFGITMECADLVSGNLNFVADSVPTLWRFNKGRYLARRHPIDNPVVNRDGITANDTIAYWLSNDANDGSPKGNNTHLPFQLFDVNSRHGLYIGYEWSFGKFVNLTGSDPLTINYKASLFDSGSVTVEQGKTLSIPAIFIGAYTGDADDGSNKMKQWFWNYRITPTLKNNPDEPLIEYCIPGSEAALIDYYKNYPVAEWGAELGKMDIDWLIGSGTDWTKGDFNKYRLWIPDSIKWPNGMTAGDIVHMNKQKLSLYMNFTFEGTDIGTAAGKEKELNALLTRYDNWHYDYWRSDMALEEKFSYRSHEGLLEILDQLIAKRPHFRYEHCANGGTLKDFTTLQRISVLTNEDSGGADLHRESYYSCSYMVNPVQLKTDVGMNLGPRGEVPKGTGFNTSGTINDSPAWVNYVLRTGFMGANMATNWCNYTPNQIAGVKVHWPLYKTRQRPILRGAKVGDNAADVYHILPIPDGVNWDGIEYFNNSLKKGSVLLFKPSESVTDSKIIRLKGLDRKTLYTISFQDRIEQNTIKTGAELMDKGIEVKGLTGKWASEIIWIN